MALAYTSPTWTDGSGTGISASQLQALCNCVEGLVQGSDKALHNIAINGSTMTLTFADGSQETASTDVKGISSIAKTGTAGLVDTYTITYTDGSTSTFTITNGSPGVDATAYHPDDTNESTLADNDRFPFYDTSASEKRRTTWENIKNKMYDYLNLDFYSKTDSTATTFNDTDYIPRYNANNGTKWKVTWSNVKSLLKTYFDTLYTKTVANPTGTATGTLTSIGINGDKYNIQGGGSTVSIADSGTASASTTSQQQLTIDGISTDISGSKYFEQTINAQANTDTTFTFTNAAITYASVLDIFAGCKTADYDIPTLKSKTLSVSGGTGTLSLVYNVPTAYALTVRVYIRG